MTRTKLLRMSAAFVLTLLVLGASMIAVEAVQISRKAERLLAEAREIKVGESNSAQVLQLVKRYHGQARKGVECTPSDCPYDIVITNRSLSRFRLAPYTDFAVSFVIGEGRTIHIDFGLMSQFKGPTYYSGRLVYGEATSFSFLAQVVDDLEYSQHYASREKYSVAIKRDYEKNRPAVVSVYLTPSADAVTRDKALAFNLGCLSKLGGCRDAGEFLPDVWRENDKSY